MSYLEREEGRSRKEWTEGREQDQGRAEGRKEGRTEERKAGRDGRKEGTHRSPFRVNFGII
jgi:hypothetical protein